MSDNNPGYNSNSVSPKRDDIDIEPELIEKLLRLDFDGPLKNAEEIVISDLPVISPRQGAKRKIGKRGPKPLEKWIRDIRKNWGDLDDVYKLGRSRLASLPEVQALATDKYEGGYIGRGRAVKELLTQALIEARSYNTDEKTHMMLSKYPEAKINVIAKECGISREQFSRNYCHKAATILTMTFLRIIGRKVNA